MAGKRRIKSRMLTVIAIALLSMGAEDSDEDKATRSDSSRGERREGTVTDVDANVYDAVRIGTQVWMIDNLRVTHYRDGTTIPSVSDNEVWSGLTTGAYCPPAVDSKESKNHYGVLYNFYAVNDSRGLCPEGWHVPTAAEWRHLIGYLGGGEMAGGKMKDTRSDLWRISVPGTTNESGFSAVPAGGRGRFGSAADVGYYATWWSSTSHDSTYAWHWGLHPDKNSIRSNPGHKASGFSVRCMKD